jgi:uncharacterized membrane protein
MKQRLIIPDIMRGLAIILMIQVHIIEKLAAPAVFNSTAGRISLFLGGVPAAPVFLLLMGFFVAHSNKKARELITRGFRLVIGGIFLNAGLNLHLFIRILEGTIELNPLPYLFGADILPLAGLSLIVAGLLTKTKPWQLLLLAFMVSGISPFLFGISSNGVWKYIFPFFWGGAYWSYFPLFPWLAYPLTGMAVYKLMEKQWVRNHQRHIIAGSIIVFAGMFIYGAPISVDLASYYSHSLPFVIWALAFMVVMIALIQLILMHWHPTKLIQYFSLLSRNVTAVYIIQWLLVGNLATAIYRSQSPEASLLWFLGILGVTSVSAWGIDLHKKQLNKQAAYHVF